MRNQVDYNTFLNWLNHRFKDYIEKDGKIRINSIYVDDRKHHLYCKPEINSYICFKSSKKGPLYQLVMDVDRCTRDEACAKLRYTNKSLEDCLRDLNILSEKKEDVQVVKHKIEFPPFCYRIMDLATDDIYRLKAEAYLLGRRLKIKGLRVCRAGKYVNRIVIPYYDNDGRLVYWNARTIVDDPHRYINPKDCGQLKGNVVYFEYFPEIGRKIFVTEGEFDAMSLVEAGFCGVALGGKELYSGQVSWLKPYEIVLAFDNDAYGKKAIIDAAIMFSKNGVNNIHYALPPKKYKDWNKFLQKTNVEVMKIYIEQIQRKYSETEIPNLIL